MLLTSSSQKIKLIKSVKQWRSRTNFLFILPCLIVIALTFLYPLIWGFFLSLSKIDIGTKLEFKFLGIGNYINVINSQQFKSALINTLAFTCTTILCELVLGMFIALILNKGLTGHKLFTIIFSLPLMLAPVVAGLQWRWLFTDQYGMINYILAKIGLKGPLWLANPLWAKISILITNLWLATPFVILVLLAGLSSISEELYKAAQIDGANGVQVFKFITLPLLKPALLAILVVRFSDAIRVFDIIYIITQGGPGGATEVLTTYIYKRMFTYLQFGEAAASSFIVLFILIVITNILFKLLRLEGEQA